MRLATAPWLVDTTLRDGFQSPSWNPDETLMLEIAKALDTAGVNEIEIGVPVRGASTRAFIKRVASALHHAKASARCRARREDIESCANLGLDIIHISVPMSQRWQNGCRRSFAQFVDQLPDLVQLAQRHAPLVSLGLIE